MEIMHACLYIVCAGVIRSYELCLSTVLEHFVFVILPPDTLVIRDVLESKPRKY